jgi:hypothetical protein
MNLTEEMRRGRILIDQCKELHAKIEKAKDLNNWKLSDKSLNQFPHLANKLNEGVDCSVR